MGEIFNTAYRDAIRLIRQMWTRILLLLGLGFLGGIVAGLLSLLVSTRLGDAVMELLGVIGVSWLIAPCLVALYRFVLSGDRTIPAWRSDTVLQFFAWSAVIQAVVAAPGLALIVLRDLSADESSFLRLGVGLLLVLYVALWVFMTRIVTLLPAVAAGRRMSLAAAFAETRGHFWFIVGATVLLLLPVAACAFIAAVVLVLILGKDSANLAVFIPLILGGIFVMVLGISLSSQLSRKFALPDAPQ